MKSFLTLILATICATSHGQTMKALSYNTTNGVVAYSGTNPLTFTNNFIDVRGISADGFFTWDVVNNSFYTDLVLQNSAIAFFGANAATAAATTRTNLGLGWPALTNSNTATQLLGVNTNGQVVYSGTNVLTFTNTINAHGGLSENGVLIWDILNNEFYAGATFHGEIAFGGTNAAAFAASTRTNLGLPLPALTNTNVSTFRQAILPTYSTNASKVLAVNSSGSDVEWINSTNAAFVFLTGSNAVTGTNMSSDNALEYSFPSEGKYFVTVGHLMTVSTNSGLKSQIQASNADVYGTWSFSATPITNEYTYSLSGISGNRMFHQWFVVDARTNAFINFSFGQTSSNSNATVMLPGSFMRIEKLP